MIHVLNDLPMEYDIQLALLEKRIVDKDKPLTVEEMREESSLIFERLNMKSTKNKEDEELEEHTLFSSQFKGKCRNRGQIGHKLFQCKNCSSHNGKNNGYTTGGNYCFYCRKLRHVRQSYFKLKKKETQYGHNQAGKNNNGNRD
jgi:hypothetical protein